MAKDLVEIRDQLLTSSGRFDLGVVGGADSGANYYINAGVRWLDANYLHAKSWARFQKDTSTTVGESHRLIIKGLVAAKEVYCQNVDGRTQLGKVTLNALRLKYADTVAALTAGTPQFFSLGVIGLSDEQAALTAVGGASPYTAEFTFDWEDLILTGDSEAPHYDRRAIIFYPPADGVYTITVFGKFESKNLSADADQNYWTMNRPDVAIKAARMQMEIDLRNSEGVRDWERALASDMRGLDADLVEEEISEISEMAG